MKLPADVRLLLERRFASRHRDWLCNAAPVEAWPLRISLGIPTEPAALQRVDAVRGWAAAWRNWQGEGVVEWSERRWRVLGTQQLPQYLVLDGPLQVAAWIGQQERWLRAQERHMTLTQRWPQLVGRLGGLFDVLADYPAADFAHLASVIEWLEAHPASALYPRQMPLAGMDTKWLEARRPVLHALLSHLLAADAGDFFSLSGLRRPPVLIRLRILDPSLRTLLRGVSDITAPVDEIAAMNLPAASVLVVENLQSGLALPDLTGSVAIIGLGYGVDVLGRIPWLQDLPARYWGDIDTHGFAILSRARAYLPQLTSMLMDSATMLAFSPLWSSEASQNGAAALALLTSEEQAVYRALKDNAWGQNVRLEQERIAWPAVLEALQPVT